LEILLGVPVLMAFGSGEQPMLAAGDIPWGLREGHESGPGRLVIRWDLDLDQDPWETLHTLNVVMAPFSGAETAVEPAAPPVAIEAWLPAESAEGLDVGVAGWLLGRFQPWGAEESAEAGPHVLPWEEVAAALAAAGTWWIGEAPPGGSGAEHGAVEGHGPEADAGDEGHGDAGQPGAEPPVEGDPGGAITTMDYGGGGYGGGGYGGGNQPPVAVDDQAFSGKIGQTVTIYVLQNDYDPDGPRPTVTSVTQPAHGTAQVAPGGGAVTYTAPPSVFQSDSFQYTVADTYGATASATVSLTLVEAEGYTVKWLDPEDSWAVLSEENWCDVEDQLQWRADLPPAGLPTISRIDFAKKPWDQRDDPTLPWQPFATNGSGDGPAVGGPGVGEWAVMPELQFYTLPNQSSFCAMAPAPGRRGVATIQEVRWETHTDPPGSPQEGGELVPGPPIRFFPDAPSPTEIMRRKVDVCVRVAPANRPGIVVDLRWFDVDDPTSSVAPIDDDPPLNQQHPEIIPKNNVDNRETWPGTDDATLPPTVAIGDNGIARGVFEINWTQPGNNYRVAASLHRASGPVPKYLDYVKPLARDQQSRLFYDKNKNEKFDPGVPGEAIIDASFNTVRASPVLTVWRKLHVEVDSMGPVVGNTTYNSTGRVTDNLDGTSTVFLATWLVDPADMNRFENGRLQDTERKYFRIKSNSASEVVVYNLPDGTIPVQGDPILLEDDDFLDFAELDDVPMPNTDTLGTALSRAFIQTLYDVGDHDTNVPFILNLGTDDDSLVAAQRWNSAADCSANYWTGYVLGAFQPDTSEDGDPDSEDGLEGIVPADGRGGAVIFTETTWDDARWFNVDRTVYEQDTVVHEVGHLFGGGEPVTRYDEGLPSVYTDKYLAQIRSAPKPDSR
jgi:hypothetical protein